MFAMSRKAKSARDGRSGRVLRIAGLTLLIAVWAFVLASMVGFHASDPPSHLVWPANSPVLNWCGTLGAAVAYHTFKLFGYSAWVLAVCITMGLFSAAVGRSVQHALVRLVGAVMLAGGLAGLNALLIPSFSPMIDLAGGTVGTVAVAELIERFGSVGTALTLAVIALVGAVVAMDEWVIAFFGWTIRVTRDHGVPAAKVAGAAAGDAATQVGSTVATAGAGVLSRAWKGLLAFVTPSPRKPVRLTDVDDEELSPAKTRRRAKEKAAKLAAVHGDVIPDPDAPTQEGDEDAPNEPAEAEDAQGVEVKPTRQKAKPAKAGTQPAPTAEEPQEESEEEDIPGAPQVFDSDALREKMSKLPIIFGQQNKRVATEADLAAMQTLGESVGDEPEKPYKFPPLDLLEPPEENFSATLQAHVEEQGASLMASLNEYRIDGKVVDAESGPAVTMYNIKLAPGTKVAQLSAVQSDIARSLKAVNIRIVANTAGRDTIGVEVPNQTREKVRLKELMGHTEIYTKMKLPMFLGKDAGGQPLIHDLAKMPHMLIAGTTGSGKSVCMNTIIMGFLYTKHPSELKLVLVDPKMVEMSQFKDIPHLMCPVVTEMPRAAAILEWACNKMEERYATLQEAGCRDIASYNELTWEELKDRLNPGTPEEEARIPRKLPYIVIVIDELADLIMTNREVEGSIIRIAQKARAVGIHLILATQRPQREVVTGLIKANMPARLTFKVASGMDSRIVLDQKGGELLLGQGDMLFLTPSSSQIVRSQGTLVDDREIRRVVKFMREVAAPSFERSLMQLRSNDSDEQRLADSLNNSSASLEAAKEDPLFNRAVEIVLETKRGSVSLLQRRLAIGYTRASRLIDLMGIAGIISDHKGSVARDVLITLEEWQAMLQIMHEQAKAQGIELPSADGPTPEQISLFQAETAAAEAESCDESDSDDDSQEPDDEDDSDGPTAEDEPADDSDDPPFIATPPQPRRTPHA